VNYAKMGIIKMETVNVNHVNQDAIFVGEMRKILMRYYAKNVDMGFII
jgi:uncharacterized protein YqfB (UPF0267 family)